MVFPSGHVLSWLGSAAEQRVSRDTVQRAAHTVDMPVQLHHIVVDAHDLPCLARFWTQALGWKVLSERANEIVIGTHENAPVGMCSCRSPIPRRSEPGAS
jgi:Flp pilus assembly protein CpaB